MNSDDSSVTDRPIPASYQELAASRREWIHAVLKPWCHSASRRELLMAEAEWTDLAGKAAPDKTLWYWAWSRYPELCQEELSGINETWPVRVILRDGRVLSGYPNARDSRHGKLSLVSFEGVPLPDCSIDEIEQIHRLEQDDH